METTRDLVSRHPRDCSVEIGTIVNINGDRGIVLNTKAGPERTCLVAFSTRIEWVDAPEKAKNQAMKPDEFVEPGPRSVPWENLPDWTYSKVPWSENWSFIGYEEFARKAWLQIEPLKRSRNWLVLACLAFITAMAIQIATDSSRPAIQAQVFGWAGIAAVGKFSYDYYTHIREVAGS